MNNDELLNLAEVASEVIELKVLLKTFRNDFNNTACKTKLNGIADFYIDPGNDAFNKIDSILSEMYGDVKIEMEKGDLDE